MNRKGVTLNTGRTHFKKGMIPWNKGKKMPVTPAIAAANKRRKGVSMPKPDNFSETMRKVNPPVGRKIVIPFREQHGDPKLLAVRNGYVFIYKPDHPKSRKEAPGYGYIREHRYIMGNHLKRLLTDSEVIHHIDGNKSNNKLSNLLLCKNAREHSRVHTMMEAFVEKLIKERKAYYDRRKKEFFLR